MEWSVALREFRDQFFGIEYAGLAGLDRLRDAQGGKHVSGGVSARDPQLGTAYSNLPVRQRGRKLDADQRRPASVWQSNVGARGSTNLWPRVYRNQWPRHSLRRYC